MMSGKWKLLSCISDTDKRQSLQNARVVAQSCRPPSLHLVPEPVGLQLPTLRQLSNTADEWEPVAVFAGFNQGQRQQVHRSAWVLAQLKKCV